jgi:hypothetical protein
MIFLRSPFALLFLPTPLPILLFQLVSLHVSLSSFVWYPLVNQIFELRLSCMLHRPCVVICVDQIVRQHMFNDPEVRLEAIAGAFCEMALNMNHSLPPVRNRVFGVFETFAIAEGADSVGGRSRALEMGSRVGDPILEELGVKSTIASKELEFAWEIIIVMLLDFLLMVQRGLVRFPCRNQGK